jgi:hypothetical protein
LIFRQPPFVIYRLIRIRSENVMQKTKNRSCSLPSSVFRHLSSDLKRPVLLQTHPGSLRSGSDHDWYARTRMTDDGKQKTEKVTLLRRCLASPSSGKPDALPLYDVKFSENGDQADCPKHPLSRRSQFPAEPYSPRAKLAIFKLIYFIGMPSRPREAFRLPFSVF